MLHKCCDECFIIYYINIYVFQFLIANTTRGVRLAYHNINLIALLFILFCSIINKQTQKCFII